MKDKVGLSTGLKHSVFLSLMLSLSGCNFSVTSDGNTSCAPEANVSFDSGTNSNVSSQNNSGDTSGTTSSVSSQNNSGTTSSASSQNNSGTTSSANSETNSNVSSQASSSSESVVSSSVSSQASSSSESAMNSSTSSQTSSTPNSQAGSQQPKDAFRVNDFGTITKNGEAVPMHCGAWFGLEGQFEPKNAEHNPGGAPMELYLGNMWWNPSGRTIQKTMDEIKAQGFNVIRLPIAPQTLNANDPQGIGWVSDGGVLKNDELVRQQNSRQALEDFIKLADENGINVILDMHSCSNFIGWRAGRLDAKPPYVDADREGYEYTREEYSCSVTGNPASVTTVHAYNKEIWLNNLREMAGLGEQLGVHNILAIDIFNEPWDYTWAEWKSLAESAYQAIDEVNSDVLIMVEGIGSKLHDGTKVPHGSEDYNPNWGENFYMAATEPLNIPKERLIISPHTYGPSVSVQKHFLDPSQAKCANLEGDDAGDADCNIVIDANRLRAGWEEHFGYLRDQGYAVVVGEFGGNWNWPNGASVPEQQRWSHITPGVDAQWQNAFVDYAKEKKIDACYWAINPESGDTGGLYGTTYDPVSNTSGWGSWTTIHNEKMSMLKRLWGTN